MTGFRLNNGDLVITNGEIELVENSELKAQTIQQVLSTNKGEWLFDTEEGIDFDVILGKHRTKKETAKDALYRQELSNMRNREDGLIEKLAKRLDGE